MTHIFFKLTDNLSGPYNNIWGNDECRHLRNHPGSTISECKELCKQTKDCTAINYNEESADCVLRACGLPVPKPQWNYPPYHGYVIDTGTLTSISTLQSMCIIAMEI